MDVVQEPCNTSKAGFASPAGPNKLNVYVGPPFTQLADVSKQGALLVISYVSYGVTTQPSKPGTFPCRTWNYTRIKVSP